MSVTTLIITLASLGLASVLYAIISVYNFNDKPTLISDQAKRFSFWGRDSWVRKYKRYNNRSEMTYELRLAKDRNFYYKFFRIKYVEKFPLSATGLVFLTDGYHFVQWFFIKLLILPIAINTPAPVTWFFILWTVWVTAFSFGLKEFRQWRD